ncbi:MULTISPECIES: hypothetical protein [Peribacillus]|uniref:hypothetical protein n=1 Tax=Peribacillus TaxID=2675229 RepID=UPI001F4E65C3|nr:MULTISPECIES: hypothetical protein [unclassified Peribacillus]MCK1982017.1 hypothetical protein [Peribacillus sp. Aquil_B1]MCK2007631.1 hypothetical protein [Peribacillus sp. Aquil_B8]
MSLIAMIIIIGCIFGGIRFWKRKRILSIILLSPLLIVFTFFGYFVYQTSYHTTPDSLELSVHKENETYLVEGRWKESLDAYRFPSDFLVFYVPENEKVSNVKRNRVKDYKDMDWKFLRGEVRDWAGKESHPQLEPQIFDLHTDNQFKFTFFLPATVKPSDVKLYYVHTREEPMEALEFWFKNIELK